ncbi:MAG: hypothetical protein Q7S72_00925, partial [Candidatus Taylorbacteria bacterium]|nr:hypothetical protein [Candidatus Taylorbacteria bacterium]
GSITVNIVADLPGENYNATVAEQKENLKIPAYKGTPKYSGFYAKFKTDITGGFSGNKMVINNDAKNIKIKAMQDVLQEQLIAKLKKDVPVDSILYDGSYTIEFITLEPVMKNNAEAELTIKGSAYGAIFGSDGLIKYIAGKEIKKFPSDTYVIDKDRALDFKISNIKDFSAKKGTPMIFTLKGPVSITGTFSESALKEELQGIELEESSAVFAKYPGIANAYALITPFWLRSFPDSVNKISIEYKH